MVLFCRCMKKGNVKHEETKNWDDLTTVPINIYDSLFQIEYQQGIINNTYKRNGNLSSLDVRPPNVYIFVRSLNNRTDSIPRCRSFTNVPCTRTIDWEYAFIHISNWTKQLHSYSDRSPMLKCTYLPICIIMMKVRLSEYAYLQIFYHSQERREDFKKQRGKTDET